MSNATYPQASSKSLPHCLRHLSTNEALDDARDLVALLRQISWFQQSSNLVWDADALRGMRTVYELLADKLDIASGRYLFPLDGVTSNAPALAERKED